MVNRWLTSDLSISYLLAELSELLIHKFGSPKCVFAAISVCSNILFIKKLPNEKSVCVCVFTIFIMVNHWLTSH